MILISISKFSSTLAEYRQILAYIFHGNAASQLLFERVKALLTNHNSLHHSCKCRVGVFKLKREQRLPFEVAFTPETCEGNLSLKHRAGGRERLNVLLLQPLLTTGNMLVSERQNRKLSCVLVD